MPIDDTTQPSDVDVAHRVTEAVLRRYDEEATKASAEAYEAQYKADLARINTERARMLLEYEQRLMAIRLRELDRAEAESRAAAEIIAGVYPEVGGHEHRLHAARCLK